MDHRSNAVSSSVLHVPRFSNRKVWLRLGLALCLSVVLLAPAALLLSRPLLYLDNNALDQDAMVVLGGETTHRPARVLQLYQQGAAPKIIISGIGHCGEVRTFLVGKGVPGAAIELECNSRSTRENALYSIPLLKQSGAKRVVLVTSWFHSRRALYCFRHYAPEIDFISKPTVEDLPKSRWPNKYELGWVLAEYLKIFGYWVCYGVKPF